MVLGGNMLIGIGGKIGTGKTTLADFLVEYFGGTILPFGEAIKEEVSKEFYIPIEKMSSQEGKKEIWELPERWHEFFGGRKKTIREIMKKYGTEYRRKQNPDYWTEKWLKKYESLSGPVFVDDVRFPDEADTVKRQGGFLTYLMPYPGQEIDDDGHASENALWDYGGFDKIFFPQFGQIEIIASSFLKLAA